MFNIVLCPKVFETERSRNSLKQEADTGCDSFEDRSDPAMDVPGLTFLHELMHWKAGPGGGLDDFKNVDHGETLPDDGYGAFNAQLVSISASH